MYGYDASIQGWVALSGVPMRQAISAFLVTIMLTLCGYSTTELADSMTKMNSESTVSITFSNGPSNGDSVTGVYTLSFSLTGNGNIASIEIDISSDGENWTSLTNISTAPWLTYFDSTNYDNGSWIFRARGWDTSVTNHTIWYNSGNFNIVNQVPVITSFEVTNPGVGGGDSALDRKWFSINSTDSLTFIWNATDDDLTHASIANVPGPGTPVDDGPGTLNYEWLWASGNMSEGTYNPRLTVWDASGLKSTKTIFIGIDRTAPTLSTPTIGQSGQWSNSNSVLISNLYSSSNDGSGSGVSHIEMLIDNTWTNVTTDEYTITLSEGHHNISMRAVDKVGNTGDVIFVEISVDITDPEGISWTVDELTTSHIGAVNFSYSAYDGGSGIDLTNSKLQYGFDLNGVGVIPDQSGRWIDVTTNGLDGEIVLSSWATKSRQYLMLRAIVVDNAGNQITTIPAAFQILPGLDLSWNSTSTTLDKIIVRPGDVNGKVQITSEINANQAYGGSVTITLESAPADRTSNVDWTVMETKVIDSGNLTDQFEILVWNYTVPNTGQWDLRLRIDSSDLIDERDEGNNDFHLVVTGASVSSIGVVTSFAPTIGALILVGLAIAWYQRKKTILPPN